MHFNFIDVLLLYYGQQHFSASHVTIYKGYKHALKICNS